MHLRMKKFIGVFFFVVFTTIYFLTAMTVAIARLSGTSTTVQLLFYVGATVVWFLIAAVIIRWAQAGTSPRLPKSQV